VYDQMPEPRYIRCRCRHCWCGISHWLKEVIIGLRSVDE
ncbi:hypothetical protein Tco_0934145, partial [Tanacetum coccineum]